MPAMEFFRTVQIFLTNWFNLYLNKLKKFFRKLYGGQHQLTSTTELNRYPELFTEAKNYAKSFGDDLVLTILSYGCSTGEEVFTLKSYFPTACIIGADINKDNLKQAIKKNTFDDVKFILSNQENLSREGKYHVIFCLSVLCRWDDTRFVTNCEAIYPFKKFEETVVQLSKMLVQNGYLIIYNSNFRLEDTVLANDFEIKPTPSLPDSGFVYKFDRNNNLLDGSHVHCIYQKKG
jgi:hypothetical protein